MNTLGVIMLILGILFFLAIMADNLIFDEMFTKLLKLKAKAWVDRMTNKMDKTKPHEHEWSNWEGIGPSKVFGSESDEIPIAIYIRQSRRCNICNLQEIIKEKM